MEMGTQLCLGNNNNNLFYSDTINKYYYRLEEKELEYYSDIINEDLSADSDRETSLKILRDNGNNKSPICETWFSDIQGVEMDGLFTRDAEVIYREDIHTFIDRLREGK